MTASRMMMMPNVARTTGKLATRSNQIEGQVGDVADKAAGGKKSVDTPAKAYRDHRVDHSETEHGVSDKSVAADPQAEQSH